ncbi:MAG: hypothetical protein ACK4ND_01725 [Cytophagaceae bacterium]
MYSKFRFTLLIICFCALTTSYAQNSQVIFGQNRVQHREFNWKLLTTANFDIYYYGHKDLAKHAGRYAEENYARITEQVGFAPYVKTKLIVYSSVQELQQSNIGLDRDNYLVGGQTHFVKSKIEVAFNGSHEDFKKEIVQGVSSTILSLMLFGGSLKDIVQSSYLLSLPEWFMSGAAAYVAEGWSREMDNYMRDRMLRGNIKNLSGYSGDDARILGQSFWNFISIKYGRSNMPTIMTLTRIIRNQETGIESIIGIPYHLILKEWENFYTSMAGELVDEYTLPQEETLKISPQKEKKISYPSFNSERTHMAYAITKEGRYSIIVRDLETGTNKTAVRGGSRLIQQREDPNTPLLSWQSKDVLTIIEVDKGKTVMTSVDIKTGNKATRKLPAFHQILGYSFSHDGRLMVMSADKEGQSDIFIFDINRNSLSQITNDLYDDRDPIFIKNSNHIVFSSNRGDDTLFTAIDHDMAYRNIAKHNNLYYYNPSKRNEVKRISQGGNHTKPANFNKNELVYLNDEKGIVNLYRMNPDSGKATQVSAFIQDIHEFSVDDKGGLAFTTLEKGRKRLYYYESYDFSKSYNTVFTYRHLQLNPPTVMHSLFKQIETLIEEGPKDNGASNEPDTTKQDDDINIHDYHFESDKKPRRVIVEKESGNFAKKETSLEKNPVSVYGPYAYKNYFSVERVTSSVMVHPLRGMGILMQSTMADIMNNHRISAGLFGLVDFRNSNLFFDYQYLKNRIDYKIRFDRETFAFTTENLWHRYSLNRIEATASYPLSQKARVSASPFVVHTRFVDHALDPATLAFRPDITNFYGGLRFNYVFDNTRLHGLNMPEGTRALISMENFVSAQSSEENFNVFVLDVRKYKRLHRTLTLATRVSYGRFFGNSPKFFMLGGMDNWLFNKLNTDGNQNPFNNLATTDKSDFMFMRFATNMRGHPYNQQWGEQYALANAELRLPIISYFSTGVVNSNFLRNLQLVGFYDLGTAWTGRDPFGTENTTKTQDLTWENSPFSASVTNYRSPLLLGYGFGLRTMFLGYYVKFDVAWGIAEEIRVPRTFYLTFGFDF